MHFQIEVRQHVWFKEAVLNVDERWCGEVCGGAVGPLFLQRRTELGVCRLLICPPPTQTVVESGSAGLFSAEPGQI